MSRAASPTDRTNGRLPGPPGPPSPDPIASSRPSNAGASEAGSVRSVGKRAAQHTPQNEMPEGDRPIAIVATKDCHGRDEPFHRVLIQDDCRLGCVTEELNLSPGPWRSPVGRGGRGGRRASPRVGRRRAVQHRPGVLPLMSTLYGARRGPLPPPPPRPVAAATAVHRGRGRPGSARAATKPAAPSGGPLDRERGTVLAIDVTSFAARPSSALAAIVSDARDRS